MEVEDDTVLVVGDFVHGDDLWVGRSTREKPRHEICWPLLAVTGSGAVFDGEDGLFLATRSGRQLTAYSASELSVCQR